jgi:hypothetical protein
MNPLTSPSKGLEEDETHEDDLLPSSCGGQVGSVPLLALVDSLGLPNVEDVCARHRNVFIMDGRHGALQGSA